MAPIHDLPKEKLVDKIEEFEGTPPGVFADPELVSLFLPALRADFAVAETHRLEQGRGKLATPILALWGRSDSLCSREEVLGWAEHTTGSFRNIAFEGGHFFQRENEAAVIKAVLE